QILRLAPREADRDDLVLARSGEPLPGREGIGMLGLLAEALDQAVADREGGEERDLLRGDRADQRFERIGRERRPESAELLRQVAHYRVLRSSVEGLEVEQPTEQRSHFRLDLGVEWLHVDAAWRGFDPHLPPTHHSEQTSLVPKV